MNKASLLRRSFFFSTVAIFLLGISVELTDQEAYYWTWSTQPALGYYEHPPLQAWLTHLLCSVLGDHTWVVRLPALLGRIASFHLLGSWVRKRWGSQTAELAQWLLLGSFFFSAGSFIALPDSVMLPFAIAAMKYADDKKVLRSGLMLGFAGLAKWTAALLAPGVAAAFLFEKNKSWPQRMLRALGAGLLALALQAPVLYWNSQNEWASFLFHLSERHDHNSHPWHFYLGNLAGFAAAQILLGGIAFVVAFAFLKSVVGRKASWGSTQSGVPLWLWILPTFAVFGLSAARGESRFYWTTVAYPALCAALALPLTRLDNLTKERFARIQSRGLFISLALVAAILWLPVGAYLKPITDTYKPYDLRHSPRGDLTGWEEWVEKDLKAQGLLSHDVAFLATDFRLTSQIAWTAKIHDMARVGTVNHQSQFKFWKRPHPSHFHRAVFFGDNRRAPGPIFGNYCGTPLTWNTRTITLLGQTVKEIHWAVCNDFKWDPIHTASWRF